MCQRSVSKKNGERGEEILKKFVNGWLDTGLLWFSAVLIPVWLMVIFKTAMSEPDVVYCMSDIYSYAHEKGLIIFLLLSQLFIINHIKYEMRAAVLVRKKSMKSYWLSLCKKIFLQAGLFVLYVFVLVTAYGVTHFQWKCNWRELNSNAYAQMQRPVEFEVAAWQTAGIFLIVLFAEITVMAMMIVLLWWKLSQPVYGYAVMMVLFTLEKQMTPAPVNIFFLRMCFPCTRLYYQGIRAGDEILFPLCCVAAAFVLGLFLMRRKNMLKKEAD